MLEELVAAGYVDQTVIQSFDASALLRIWALPDISICALHGFGAVRLGNPQPADVNIVAPNGKLITVQALTFEFFFNAVGLIHR